MPGLAEALQGRSGPERLAAAAAWLQGLYRDESATPVLVGGSAVELYTGGAYRTGDLDFVGSVPPAVASQLKEAGFRRQGRHWIHDEQQLFFEFPSTELDEGDRWARIEVGPLSVVILGFEETLVDRLAAWQFWRSEIDAVNAFLLWRAGEDRMDLARLRALAKSKDVAGALASLETFVAGLPEREPIEAELRAWARTFP